jgi:hypothetical protein
MRKILQKNRIGRDEADCGFEVFLRHGNITCPGTGKACEVVCVCVVWFFVKHSQINGQGFAGSACFVKCHGMFQFAFQKKLPVWKV